LTGKLAFEAELQKIVRMNDSSSVHSSLLVPALPAREC